MKPIKVLSLFDGISCGMVALERAGIEVSRYVAYEIDKYAIKISKKNYPQIEQMGDVFDGDFTQYSDFDLLIGGSPCTYWSIAKNGRETNPDGIGGQMFMQYVRALRESGIPYFLYENNYSIHKNIKAFISEKLGVAPIVINSSLLSAQNRKRCYWTNIEDVEQPEDKGLVAEDIIDGGVRHPREQSEMHDGIIQRGSSLELARAQSADNGCYAVKVGRQGQVVKKNDGKALCILARDYKGFGNQEMNGVMECLKDAQYEEDTSRQATAGKKSKAELFNASRSETTTN